MLGRKSTFTLVALGTLWGVTGLAQAADPVTLWNFLGIPQGIRKIQGATINRRGNFPGLERKPPLKALADPRNLESKNPAIKKAAEIKTEEDLAKQKIKALKYLATIGCGCYPGVKEALLAALDDCTEKVRYQAALAIGEAASNHCATCNRDCCCDEEMTKRLAEVAYERDDHGCWLEPSERVRDAAREAMCACCRSKPDRGGYPVETEMLPQVEGEIPDTTLPGEIPDTIPSDEVPNNDPPPPPPSPEARHEAPALIFSSAAKAPAPARVVAETAPVQPAPARVLADKIQIYRQQQPRTSAVEPAPAVREQARPLALARAVAALEQVPADADTDEAEADLELTNLAAEPSAPQAYAVERPTPRYALVTAIAEPQRSTQVRRPQPVVRPISR